MKWIKAVLIVIIHIPPIIIAGVMFVARLSWSFCIDFPWHLATEWEEKVLEKANNGIDKLSGELKND